MDTSAISYRVADFLKQYPPFHAVQENDLLELAARGRVKFHEPNEYIVWQGEPHKLHVFVIQQGTVSLWDEADGQAILRDVRGPGDLLGIERFSGARRVLHSARSASDVLIYAFPASDVEDLLRKYPHARQFMEAHDAVTADYERAADTRDLQGVFLHEVLGRTTLPRCAPGASIRDVARAMQASGAEALAVVDAADRLQSVVTIGAVLDWVASGTGSAEQPLAALLPGPVPVAGSTASVIDGVLAMAGANAPALAMTADGSPGGQLLALVTQRDIARAFGDQPIAILQDIQRASSVEPLRGLVHRARAMALHHLTAPASIDWLAPVVSSIDAEIVKRIIVLEGADLPTACWCVCGASGRHESLTRHAPQLVLVLDDERDQARMGPAYDRVADALATCDYLARTDLTFDRAFCVATTREWLARYETWLRDPVRAQMYLARPLFDLRPIHGPDAPCRDIEASVTGAVDRDLLYVLANDSLARLPPLSFFEDAVVEESGERTAVFRLAHSALQPLVDVGRVFGMATEKVLGTSTRERFACARTLLPEHEWIFRDAAETVRVLLSLQARIGISQGTTGSELPPALLSRHDRHILKGGFRSILRLLEFTGNAQWFDAR